METARLRAQLLSEREESRPTSTVTYDRQPADSATPPPRPTPTPSAIKDHADKTKEDTHTKDKGDWYFGKLPVTVYRKIKSALTTQKEKNEKDML